MGQKVNPNIFRMNITKKSLSSWFVKRSMFSEYVIEDMMIRNVICSEKRKYIVSDVVIERDTKNITVSVHTSSPGILIGSKGKGISTIKDLVSDIVKKDVKINVIEVKNLYSDAKLVAASIAKQISARSSPKKVIKKTIKYVMSSSGMGGIRVIVSGRLNGAEMARSESFHEGRIPLHTLRADVSHAISVARTTYGVIGIKVMMYKLG